MRRKIFSIPMALCACALLSGCKLTSGQDPGLMSTNSIILNSLVVTANCGSDSYMGETYRCLPDVTISKKVDPGQLTWELTPENTCSWISINPTTGEVFGAPALTDARGCVLAFRVRTSEEPSSAYTLSVQVNGPPITVSQRNCSTTVGVLSNLTCDIDATSRFANVSYTFSLAADNTCTWAQIQSSSGVLSGSPNVSNAGTCTLSVDAAIGDLSKSNLKFMITIPRVSVSVAPVTCPATALVEGQYRCTLNLMTNLTGQTPVWRLANDNTCAWVSIQAADGTVTGVPTLAQVGSCRLSVAVNIAGVTATYQSTITVPQVPVTVRATCVDRLDAGTPLSCQPTASAPIASPVFSWSLSAANTCTWATINSSTGLLGGTPPIAATGTCVLGVSASLQNGAAGTATSTIRLDIKGYREINLDDPEISVGALAGSAVAIDGIWAAVGAPDAVNGDGSTGFVSIFRFDGVTWVKAATLRPNVRTLRRFGHSVAISGSALIVGAPDSTDPITRQGAVAFYELSGAVWSHRQTVWSPTTNALAAFGSSVDIDGSRAIVRTSHYLTPAAFILERTTAWNVVTSLNFTAVDSNLGADRISVGLSGTLAVVADIVAGSTASGEATVFQLVGSTWMNDGRLSGTSGDSFGRSVALSGGKILVGAPGATSSAGRAYLFERGGTAWSLTNTFVAIDSASNKRCGSSVSLTTTRALIGCPHGVGSGSAYLHNLTSSGAWMLESKLVPSRMESPDYFGAAVGISDSTLLIGAPLKDVGGMSNPGASSIFVAR